MAIVRNHILVPVDFSDQSLIALGQAQSLARISKADLTLIHIIDDPFFNVSFFSRSEKEKKSAEKKIQKELQRLAKETTDKFGVRTDTMIVHGKIYEEIQKVAKKLKCSFIVMGTGGSVGIKKFIGSNALRVIREATCPVITIKGKKHRTGCKHILLPLDLSEETKEKVNKAIDFAKIYGSTINLMTVLTTDDEFITNKLKRQMNQVEQFIVQHNVNCTVEFVEGSDVAEEVMKHAKKIKADIVMIMTQQEMYWTDMFIGSEAQQIINHCDIPVLSIRPKERHYESVMSY
jgi:nucleotide-binding universal stress UspA family protein